MSDKLESFAYNLYLALVFVVALLAWRLLRYMWRILRKKPSKPCKESSDPPRPVYLIGILILSIGALVSFSDNDPYHGTFFIILVLLGFIGLATYPR